MRIMIILTVIFLVVMADVAEASKIGQTYKFGERKGQPKLTSVQRTNANFSKLGSQIEALGENNQRMLKKILQQDMVNTERIATALEKIASLIAENNALLKTQITQDKEDIEANNPVNRRGHNPNVRLFPR